MRKILLISVLLIIIATFTFGCTGYNADLLAGGDFEYDDTTALQEEWNLSSGGTDSSAVFTVSDGALEIDTSTAGWAYAAQEVKLSSNAYYKVSYTFMISSITYYKEYTSLNGLFIGFLEDDDFNIGEAEEGVIKPIIHNGTTTTAVSTQIYVKTGYITKASLAIYVGTEDSPVSADVAIKEISIERVKKSDVPVTENPDTGKDVITAFELQSDIFGANTDKNIIFIIIGGVFTLLAGYAAYVMMQRSLHVESNLKNKFLVRLRESKYFALILIIGIALLVRLAISITSTALATTANTYYLGYNVEAAAAQAQFISEYGTVYLKSTLETFTTEFSYAYQAIGTSPMMLYVLGLAGLISKLFNGGIVITTLIIKLFVIAADIGVIVLIYKLLHNRVGKLVTFVMCTLYSLLPVVFGISAGWGITEAITVFLIMLTLYFIVKNNYWGVAITYFVAFITSVNAIFMLPIVLLYVINQFIIKKKMRLPILISLVVSILLFYAVSVPFDYLEIVDGKTFVGISDYWTALTSTNNVYTANAFNFQALLKNNFEVVTTESVFITILFVVFIIALVAVGYFKNKNRMEMLLLGSLLVAMLFTFTNRMNPVSMYMALPLMFVYAVMNKEKRVYFITIIYALLMFINTSYVYMVAGYSTSGIEQLSYDGNVMMYVFGAINIVTTGYFIYVVYDIVAGRKAARIKPMTIPYKIWVKNVGLRIQKFFYDIKTNLVRK